jgi:hypothetical protein
MPGGVEKNFHAARFAEEQPAVSLMKPREPRIIGNISPALETAQGLIDQLIAIFCFL